MPVTVQEVKFRQRCAPMDCDRVTSESCGMYQGRTLRLGLRSCKLQVFEERRTSQAAPAGQDSSADGRPGAAAA